MSTPGPGSAAAGHDRQPSRTAVEHDPVEWMRQRWLDRGAPLPNYFAAMASLLRTSLLLTDELDRILRDHELSRTAYLILITLQMSDRETRPLGQLSRALVVHPTTVTLLSTSWRIAVLSAGCRTRRTGGRSLRSSRQSAAMRQSLRVRRSRTPVAA